MEAGYRFFGNAAVNPDAILAGHFEGVRSRAEQEETVLALQDTSVITFHHDGQRLGTMACPCRGSVSSFISLLS